METLELKRFLSAANRAGYGNPLTKETDEPDGSHTIAYSEGEWHFHDNFFGGEPFGGREVVFYQGKAVWMMAYYGRVSDPGTDISALYAFLKKSLMAFSEELPLRGPELFEEGAWKYECVVRGTVEEFHGHETIFREGKPAYEAFFEGGVIDLG